MSALLNDNRLVSRYLERSSKSQYKVNYVELKVPLKDKQVITDFYFDQVLLILKLQDTETGLESLEFFNLFAEKYVYLDMIPASKYFDAEMVVDDRLSNVQNYRVIQTGFTIERQLEIQVIRIDLVSSFVDEGRVSLT